MPKSKQNDAPEYGGRKPLIEYTPPVPEWEGDWQNELPADMLDPANFDALKASVNAEKATQSAEKTAEYHENETDLVLGGGTSQTPAHVDGGTSQTPNAIQQAAERLAAETVAKLQAQKDAAPKEARFKVHEFSETTAPDVPVDFVVKDIFALQTVSFVVGKPGHKKTWLMDWLALCVSQGRDFLGHETTPYPVLIVDTESGPKSTLRRLRAGGRGLGVSPDANISWITLDCKKFSVNEPDDVTALRDEIIRRGAKLVIIDNFAGIFSGDENSKADVQPVFDALRPIAATADCCILIIHHLGKSGDYRGSSAIDGGIDVMVTVTSEPDKGEMRISHLKVRDIQPFCIDAFIRFDFLPGEKDVHSFAIGMAEKQDKPEHVPPSERKVIEALDALGENVSAEHILNAAQIKSETPIDGARRKGFVKRANPLTEKTALYSLTTKGAEWCNENLH